MAATLALQFAAVSPRGADEASSLRSRVEMATAQAAVAISGEATSVANHANRVVLARLVLNDPDNYAYRFALTCAAEGIDDLSTDTQISDMVASVWDALAGVV